MAKIRCFVSSALLVLAGLGAARAEDKVLVPGNPPLTQGMVDDYCRYFAWRWPQAFASAGGSQRLGQMVVNDWRGGDGAKQKAVLADLKWWREDFPKLNGADPRLSAREQEAIRMARLQQWNDARQQEIRALSNLQASHHETMMVIINNMRPTGRYVYNPATGRYDRYVP
jgi:hypothetical protein